MNSKKMFPKILCLLLTFLMLISNVNLTVFAEPIPLGKVTVSFEDYGVRIKCNEGDFKTQLGEIIPPTEVPFYEGDSIAKVTLRLLDTNGIKYSNTGSVESGFYLAAIKDFQNNIYGHIKSFGEFDSGSASGWMITLNNWFINMGASEFKVEDGDVIRWQNTCQLGADIGCDWNNGSAKIKGLKIDSKYGTLSPTFSDKVKNYTLTVPNGINSVKVEALQENYWAILTYRVGKNYYKLLRDIPVSEGTEIALDCAFSGYAGQEPTDTDKITITIKKAAPTVEEILRSTKTKAMSELEGYKNPSDYRADERQILKSEVNKGKTEIGNASGIDDVATALASAKLIIDKIKTDTDFTIEQGGYKLTVKVAPITSNVKFYTCKGFDSKGYDLIGDEITAKDGGVVNGYHIYTMAVAKGTYSYRATDSDNNNIGGMTFDVPVTTNVDGTSNNNCEVVLRQTEIYTNTKIDGINYAIADQYSVKLIDADGKLATFGNGYKSGDHYRYSTMAYAGGNAELYTIQLIPSDLVSNTYALGTNTMINYTIPIGTTVIAKSGVLPTLINTVISAPAGAKVEVFNQIKNYYTKNVTDYSVNNKGDGMIDYTYRLPKNNSNHTYRVSMEGKITKAGYLNLSSVEKAVTTVAFRENENPELRYDYMANETLVSYLKGRLEDSVLLNVNKQNYLHLDENGIFKLRGYRAAWQIINSDVANIMIEPDFHFKILSGDSVTIEQDAIHNNFAMLKAVKKGITIIEVTYDAIEIGGNTNYTGIYGANDPARKGIVVVDVGGDKTTNIDLNIGKWDAEMDTVYYADDIGKFSFQPKSSKEISVKIGNKVYKSINGKYTVDIKEGYNLVEIYSGHTVEYMLIRGKKVSYKIINNTNPGGTIKQGDNISINFNGLHMPVPKFSGIYNPGFTGTMKLCYRTKDGGTINSNGTQYDFISNHTLTFTVWEEGDLNLINGSMPMSMMCDPTDPWGQHRTLKDTGVGANFNASEVKGEFSTLPDITIKVAKNEDLAYIDDAKDNMSKLNSVNIIYGNGGFQRDFSFSYKNQEVASKKNYGVQYSDLNENYPFMVTAVATNSDTRMEFRYWIEGKSKKHVYPLKSGETLNLGKMPFGANVIKNINMEIAVIPLNPLYGKGEVYSYVAYRNQEGYPRPILQTLEVIDKSGVAFTNGFGVLHSENGLGYSMTATDYYCYVPSKSEFIKFIMKSQKGIQNVKIGDGELQPVGMKNIITGPIKVNENDETLVTFTVETDGASEHECKRIYSVKLIEIDEHKLAIIKANDILRDATESYKRHNVATEEITTIYNDAISKVAQSYNNMDAFFKNVNKEKNIAILSMQNAVELGVKKLALKNELDSYKKAEDYREAQKAELEKAISDGKSAIHGATDLEKINAALESAKQHISRIKTNEQLTLEEKAASEEESKLNSARLVAKNELDSYKKAEDYREAQKAELTKAISDGKSAIHGATDIQKINAALESAKQAIGRIKTNEQLMEEEKIKEEEKTANQNEDQQEKNPKTGDEDNLYIIILLIISFIGIILICKKRKKQLNK